MSRLAPASGVAHLEQGAVVYAATLPAGPILVLDGGAAAIWAAACEGPRDTIAERVAQATGADLAEVRSEVESFVEELLGLGLLADERD